VTATPLGPGPEFDRIRAIAAVLGSRATGLGDDCAIVRVGTKTLALSTDASVEGVHFRREWLSLEEVGWRATAGCLSDLAAAGALPIGVLVALTMPAADPPAAFASVMDGVGRVVTSVGGTVLGGDLTKGDVRSITVTGIGRVESVIGRQGARPGDELWVTGELGGARAAWMAMQAGREPDTAARARFALPVPRVAAGRRLVEGGARAMIDLSDGLAGDARHLAAASRVMLRIDLAQLPCHPAARVEAETQGEPAEVFAAKGGEDYELLVVMPPGATGNVGIAWSRIGQVESGEGVVLELAGRAVALEGYDHFA